MDPHAYGVIFELYKTDIVGMLLVCLDDSMNPFHAYRRVAVANSTLFGVSFVGGSWQEEL